MRYGRPKEFSEVYNTVDSCIEELTGLRVIYDDCVKSKMLIDSPRAEMFAKMIERFEKRLYELAVKNRKKQNSNKKSPRQ